MPIYVGLVNWTEQGTREFRGSVERANGFRQLVEQAGGRVREMVWTMGAYDFITVFDAPDDETAAALVLRVAAAGNVHTKTMRAFDADQMSAWGALTATGPVSCGFACCSGIVRMP